MSYVEALSDARTICRIGTQDAAYLCGHLIIRSRKWTRSINNKRSTIDDIMKKTLGTLALSLLCASTWAQTYDPANNEYYQVVTGPNLPWLTAEQTALTMYYNGLEGHLVTITSQAEDTFVGNVVQAFGAGEFWAGGYQNPVTELNASAGWTWVNNQGTFPGVNGAGGFDNAYSNWNPGEPNDAYGEGSEQYLGLNRGSVGGFNDEGNLSLIEGFVVEYDPLTVPNGGLAPDGGSTAAFLGGALTLLGFVSRRFRK
jgi:hypothetical protein